MHVIQAVNVNDAYVQGMRYIREVGERMPSRAGEVLVAPTPVTTVYLRPLERILFDPIRDVNVAFSLFEPLWMLAGHQNARWLDQFVHDFSARFAEEDGTMHGAYGYRWRRHFKNPEFRRASAVLDQLDVVVRQLRQNPDDRQVVIQMWDPTADLLSKEKKDRPCNLCVLPRIIKGQLHLTVFCRSNDLIWGAYSANAAQFSFLQEYLAARIGVGVGVYTQISNNYHAYTAVLEAFEERKKRQPSAAAQFPACYPEVVPLIAAPDSFDRELDAWLLSDGLFDGPYRNQFFTHVATPMLNAHRAWKRKASAEAFHWLEKMPDCDWRVAAWAWFSRRMVGKGLEPKEYVR